VARPAPDPAGPQQGGPPWLEQHAAEAATGKWNGASPGPRANLRRQARWRPRQCLRSAGPPDGECLASQHCSIPLYYLAAAFHSGRGVGRPPWSGCLQARRLRQALEDDELEPEQISGRGLPHDPASAGRLGVGLTLALHPLRQASFTLRVRFGLA